MNRRHFLLSATAAAAFTTLPVTRAAAHSITTPMTPPEWALLQREALRVQSEAVEVFYNRYFDERGYFQCFERWGANDGPDDAIENCNDGLDSILNKFKYLSGFVCNLSAVRKSKSLISERI
jgi:hypothetical protein